MDKQLRGKTLLLVMQVSQPRGFPTDVDSTLFKRPGIPNLGWNTKLYKFHRNKFNNMSLREKNKLRTMLKGMHAFKTKVVG